MYRELVAFSCTSTRLRLREKLKFSKMTTTALTSVEGSGRLQAGSSVFTQDKGFTQRRAMSLLAAISASATCVQPIVAVGGRAASPQFVVSHRGITLARAVIGVASIIQGQGDREREQTVPLPVVHIDQHSDPDATIVVLSFGDRLGALLDTTKALKNLGLNVVKAKVTTEASVAKNTFYITRSDNGNKVENPELLEAIRLTIINNLLKYHPESSEQLFLGETFGVTPPKVKLDVNVATHISVKKVNSKSSLLTVETADRPGLLLEIISVITDISILVESAEIDTEGLVAKDKFYVSYGGAALSKSLEEVLTNCLRYHIRKGDSEDESY